MRKLLNTLYITKENTYLKLDGLNVLVTKDNKEISRVPFCNIESIVCFNYMGCSPALMARCAEENVSLSFVSPNGKFLAKVTGKTKGNIYLRRQQFKDFENEDFCFDLAKQTILAKITNTKSFVSKFLREYSYLKPQLDSLISKFDEDINNVKNSTNIDSLRGFEGNSARSYFSKFNCFLLNNEFDFKMRTKRPPLDEVNSMLSYLYTLLALDCQSALEVVGLDPYMGYFHTDRPGRPALALDIMEEFRCYFVDRCVLNLINLKKVTKEDFIKDATGAILIKDEAKKIIINEWQKRKFEEIVHPILREKVPVGLLPYIQARLMAKFLRGEMDKYCPFVIKL